MKVRVDELPEVGRLIHFHRDASWFAGITESLEKAREITLARPLNADLELTPEQGQVKISGRVQATIQLPCSRCLQDFTLAIDESIFLVLLRPLADETREEVDLRAEDLNTELFDGVTIDLDGIIVEEIFLALPQKPLCQTTCKGLCPDCGVNLNLETCTCEGKATGSAFAALKALKIDK